MIPSNLLAIGDTHTETIGFVEQVTGITAFNQDIAGLTSTRTVRSEFRWSTTGTFSGSFIALTIPQLMALVLDADNRFHTQVRWTRTGTDATGIIQINAITFSYTIDPNALYGHGSFTVIGMFEETKEFSEDIPSGVFNVETSEKTESKRISRKKSDNLVISKLANKHTYRI